MTIKDILKKAVEQKDISIADYNSGICVWIVYRICWKTQTHNLLYAMSSAQEARKFCASHNGVGEREYFYEQLKLN